MLIPFTVFIAK